MATQGRLLLVAALLCSGSAVQLRGQEEQDEPSCPEVLDIPDCVASDANEGPCLDWQSLRADAQELGLQVFPDRCQPAATQMIDEVPGPAAKPTPGKPNRHRKIRWTNRQNPCNFAKVGTPNVTHKKPIMWVHVHKSMGTLVFLTAMNNGEWVVCPNFNGNWFPHDTPSGTKKPVSCEDRGIKFRENSSTWGQIEHTLNEDDLCFDDFSYGVMLRDPNDVAVSKTNFELWTKEEMADSLSCVSKGHCNKVARKINSWELWWFFDNFLVRSLGGNETWELPPGKVTRSHFELVMQRLKQFHMVMFLEDLLDPQLTNWTLGWQKLPTYRVNHFSHHVTMTPEQEKQARKQNKWDYELYNYFRSLPAFQRLKRLP